MRTRIILKFSKVYLIFCLCFNQKKLEATKKAEARAQENEFLREEYMKIVKNLKKIYNNGEIMLDRIALEKLSIYLGTDKIKKLLHQE
mmetsp:Transcript_34088/g.33276  ORF Transcript_34088/g.33276 Transcript_34088/m.33276 type:complete len:88 (+) Transcript_34088:352-615(+)